MAQTKVKLISDGVIVQGNLHASHGITTAHIGEGSNLYYTDARVGSYLSTNSFATESYVGTQIANLVDSSPSALNTLNELAAALGDDANFSTTVTNSIALKAPLASPTFTGFARAPYIRATSGGDIALGSISGISRIQGDSNQDIRFLNSSNQDLLTLVASSRAANFAGDVNVEDNLYLTDAGTVRGKIQLNSSDRDNLDIKAISLGSLMRFYTVDTLALTLDASQNATFAGELTISQETQYLNFKKASTADVLASIISETDAGTGGKIRILTKRNGDTAINALTIDDNQNVGIGTDSPETNAKLDVRAGSGGKIVLGTYDANYKVVVEGGDQLNFYNGTSATTAYMNYGFTGTPGNILLSRNLFVEANSSGGTSGTVRIKSDGKVGIGTTSPSTKLHISGGDPSIRLTPSGSNDARVDFTDSGGTVRFYTGYDVSSGNFVVTSDEGGFGSSNIMVMNDSGNVGIGTTSLGSYDNESDDLVVFNSTTPGITIATDNAASRGALRFADGTSGNETYRGALEYNHSGDIMSFRTAGVQRMNLTSDGNLVIGGGSAYLGTGVTSLTVNNDSYPTLALGSLSANRFAIIAYNTYNLFASSNNFVFDSGKVGIGTTVMNGKLSVAADDGTSTPPLSSGIYVGPYQGNTAVGSAWSYSNSGTTYTDFSSRYNNSDSNMRFIMKASATPVYAMTIKGDGRVGIGNTSPNNKLEISDTGTGYGTTYLKISRGADSSTVARVAGIKMGNTASNDGSNWLVQAESSLGYFDDADLNFYHNGGGTAVSKFKIKKNAEVISQNHQAGSHGFVLNGLNRVSNTGYVAGTGTLSITYDCLSQGSFFIQCVFNHYGFISSYGCARVAVFANGPNLQIQDLDNITSSNGGSWTITRVSNTRFTVAKTAGSYGGGGYYMVNITGTGLKYT